MKKALFSFLVLSSVFSGCEKDPIDNTDPNPFPNQKSITGTYPSPSFAVTKYIPASGRHETPDPNATFDITYLDAKTIRVKLNTTLVLTKKTFDVTLYTKQETNPTPDSFNGIYYYRVGDLTNPIFQDDYYIVTVEIEHSPTKSIIKGAVSYYINTSPVEWELITGSGQKK